MNHAIHDRWIAKDHSHGWQPAPDRTRFTSPEVAYSVEYVKALAQ